MTHSLSTTGEPQAQAPGPGDLALHYASYTEMISQIGDQDLATAIFDMSRTLRVIEGQHALETLPLRDRIAIGRAVLEQRIVAAGGHAVAHPDLVVELDQRTKIDKRIDVLRELEGLVPEPELRPALALVQVEPEWVAHAGKLATLARKYGGKVAEIVARGVLKVAVGSPTLTIREREPEHIASSTPTGDAP
ncbi:MAG: hypothetical protein ACYDCJ_12375 [Gammaproteobacteria bacterium]